MNNRKEKYIYLLTAPAPWLRPFSLAQAAATQDCGFSHNHHQPFAGPHHPIRDCLCSVWSWALLSVLEMGNQAWFWKGQASFGRRQSSPSSTEEGRIMVRVRITVMSSEIFAALVWIYPKRDRWSVNVESILVKLQNTVARWCQTQQWDTCLMEILGLAFIHIRWWTRGSVIDLNTKC